MNPYKFSAIAHRDHDYRNPVPAGKIERLLEDPSLLQTPIVRNGRQATVGYCPDVWKTWE